MKFHEVVQDGGKICAVDASTSQAAAFAECLAALSHQPEFVRSPLRRQLARLRSSLDSKLPAAAAQARNLALSVEFIELACRRPLGPAGDKIMALCRLVSAPTLAASSDLPRMAQGTARKMGAPSMKIHNPAA